MSYSRVLNPQIFTPNTVLFWARFSCTQQSAVRVPPETTQALQPSKSSLITVNHRTHPGHCWWLHFLQLTRNQPKFYSKEQEPWGEPLAVRSGAAHPSGEGKQGWDGKKYWTVLCYVASSNVREIQSKEQKRYDHKHIHLEKQGLQRPWCLQAPQVQTWGLWFRHLIHCHTVSLISSLHGFNFIFQMQTVYQIALLMPGTLNRSVIFVYYCTHFYMINLQKLHFYH